MATFSPKVRLWPGKSLSDDASTWGVGVDITSYVRQPGQDGGQRISYTNGRQDEGNQIDAGTLNLTLDNRTGIWSPQNVNGTYHGQLGRSTPIQLAVDVASDDFNRTAGAGLGTSSSGHAWTATSSWSRDGTAATGQPAVSAVGRAQLGGADTRDFDLRYTCWVNQVATGASLIMGGAGRYASSTDTLHFRCEFTTAGQVDARIGQWTGAGLVDLAVAASVFTYAANTKVRVRCVADGTNVRMKIWKPANPADPDADEPDAWNSVGTDPGAGGLQVGLMTWRLTGNTNVSPIIYADDFAVEAIEWTGSVVQWPSRWDKTGNNSWAPIQAAGQLRRLRQGQGLLQSPLRRQLATYSPTGFWPLEDGAGSTQFASAVTNRQPGIPDRVSAAGSDDLPGASVAPTFDAADSSIMFRTVRTSAGSSGFAVMFLFKLSSLPGGTTRLARIYVNDQIVSRWDITISDTIIGLEGYSAVSPGVTVVTTNIGMAAIINPVQWVAVQLETDLISGARIDWDFIVHQVGETDYYAQASNYVTPATAAPVVTSVTLGGTLLQGAAFSMLWVGPNSLPFVDNTFSLVSSGYEGELAADRAARVALEAGVPLDVEAGDSEPMGAQREGTVLEVLRSCEGADYGILYETAGGRLGFRPRTARFNPSPLMTLDMASGHLAEAPEPIYDDQRLRNVWTVARVGGSSATVVDDASVAADGEVAGSDSINVQQDAVLENHAAWRVHLGVEDGLRWPSIVLDFARNPDLLTYWRSRQYGFRFTVETGLPQVAGAEADVIAEGYQAELWPDGWRVTLNCSSASPWRVAVLDDASEPVRLDTAGSELASGVTTTATSWSVATTEGPIWSTATTFPFDLKCEGEIVTVSAISGGASPQTFTVTRSVNGIIKAHSAGAAVSLAYPSRLAL